MKGVSTVKSNKYFEFYSYLLKKWWLIILFKRRNDFYFYFQILGNSTDPKNGCACEAGWQGEKCDKCVPYWNCPNQNVNDPDDADGLACSLPNQCFCKVTGDMVSSDDGHLCNSDAINAGASPPWSKYWRTNAACIGLTW